MSTEQDFLLDEEPEVATGGGIGINGQGKMPTMEEIMRLIDAADGLSEEEKASIKEDVLKFNSPGGGLDDNGYLQSSAVAGGLFAPPTLLFIFLVAVIVLIIGFFVYKLIKAEINKEKAKAQKKLAREERRNKKKK